MNLLTIVVIALGLAMDAFAVSVTIGAVYKKPGISRAFRTALTFSGFQAAMPLIGWLTGMTVRKFVEDYDHWIAFCLLAAAGCKMIYESFKIKRVQQRSNSLRIPVLLALAVATSIDAFAVGITLSFLLTGSIAITVIIIGAVTFVLSYAGVYIGKGFGYFFANRIEALGGLVLLGIGTKILLEHLFFLNT